MSLTVGSSLLVNCVSSGTSKPQTAAAENIKRPEINTRTSQDILSGYNKHFISFRGIDEDTRIKANYEKLYGRETVETILNDLINDSIDEPTNINHCKKFAIQINRKYDNMVLYCRKLYEANALFVKSRDKDSRLYKQGIARDFDTVSYKEFAEALSGMKDQEHMKLIARLFGYMLAEIVDPMPKDNDKFIPVQEFINNIPESNPNRQEIERQMNFGVINSSDNNAIIDGPESIQEK